MPIRFRCPAGHLLTASRKRAGSEIHCPACKVAVVVPEASTVLQSTESSSDDAPVRPAAAPPKSKQRGAWSGSEGLDKPEPKDATATAETESNADSGASPRARWSLLSFFRRPGKAEQLKAMAEATVEETSKRTKPKAEAPKRATLEAATSEAAASETTTAKATEAKTAATEAETIDTVPEPAAEESPRAGRSSKGLFRRGKRLVPPDAYTADEGHLASVKWLAVILTLAVLFSMAPGLSYLNLETAPGWARCVLLIGALQLFYIAWVVNKPDWASVWVLMLVFAGVSTLYGMATAVAIATPLDKPMLLGMGPIRNAAGSWCGSVLLVMSLSTYLCGRNAAKWRRSFELSTAGKRRGG